VTCDSDWLTLAGGEYNSTQRGASFEVLIPTTHGTSFCGLSIVTNSLRQGKKGGSSLFKQII